MSDPRFAKALVELDEIVARNPHLSWGSRIDAVEAEKADPALLGSEPEDRMGSIDHRDRPLAECPSPNACYWHGLPTGPDDLRKGLGR